MSAPRSVHRPSDTGEAASLMSELSADGPPPLFTGSSPGDLPDFVREAVEADGRPVVSTGELDGIVDYRPEDLTVTVGAGVRMSGLRERLREEGQWIPLSGPGLRRSAGGLVAAVPPTPYAGEYGPVRRQVLAVRVVSHGGERLDWGRAVVKNVAGYDMPRLVCGSRGRLGLATRVTFRVWPLPEVRRRFELRPGPGSGDTAELAGATVGVDASRDWQPEAEAWRWSADAGETPTLVVELSGSSASVDARRERLERWAVTRDLRLERGPVEGGEADASPRPARRRPCLRFRVGPGYVAHVVTALRETPGTEEIVAHPREGVVTARLDPGSDGDAAVSAGNAAAPDAGVEVARGGPGLHERAASLRDTGRVELEQRVVTALGGRDRPWAGDFV